MSIDKNIDVNRLSISQKESTTIFTGDEKNSNIVGFAGGNMRSPVPTFIEAGHESILPSNRDNTVNAQFVITRDRPNSIFSAMVEKVIKNAQQLILWQEEYRLFRQLV